MKIPLVGGSSQQRSLPFNAERTINLIPISDPEGKEVSSLLGGPGLTSFATVGIGEGRKSYTAANGRVFQVVGPNVLELFSDGTTSIRGTLDQSSGLLTVAENGFQLAICDGANLYIFTYATNAFAKVVNVNLPSAATVTFIDGYFVVNRVASGIFQISGLYDGFSWGALDFATAESSPDNLLLVINIIGQLWLVGVETTEIWSNNGGSGFPFTRISGAKMEVGIWAPYTGIELDNSFFWVGRTKQGAGIVYRAEGFSPRRISTEPIEILLQNAPWPALLRSYSYQEDGHTYLVITGGGMETALVYDLSTQIWHESARLNDAGAYELPLIADICYGFDKHLGVCRTGSKIYDQSLDYYSEDGGPLVRDRIFTNISDENARVLYKDLTVGFETGVGNQNGDGSDPKAILYLSRDGGITWSDGMIQSLGQAGKYLTRVIWRRLGQARIMTFRVRVTDPVKVTITGAYLNTGGA